MLDPSQFELNEAWIAFQLNTEPIGTEQDGQFDCVALMDAASCFIYGMAMVPMGKPEPSKPEFRRLIKKAWKTGKQYPRTLFIPAGRFEDVLPAEAERLGIAVVRVPDSQLLVFTRDARAGFKEHFSSRRGEE